jgi:APA family basic amino acid/polyamine antiporter
MRKRVRLSKPNVESIGFYSLVCLVIANMIGSGLYTSSGFALASLGRPDLVMWVWAMAGAMALCGAIAYGSIAKRLPESGGEYLYLSRLIHPSIGFLAGWISLVAGFTGPLAAAALVFAVYADIPLMSVWGLDQKAIASLVIVTATLVHALKLEAGLWAQNGAVAIKLAGLGVLIVWGFRNLGLSENQFVLVPSMEQTQPSSFFVALTMLSSLVWISLSYTGFNAAVYVAGESKDARSIVPMAMLTATVLVTAIYLCLNYLFLFGCDPKTIAGEPKIAEVAATAIGGVWMSRLMTGVILLSSWTSVLSLLMTGPRVYAKMADDHLLPRLFRQSNNVPRIAIVVQAVLAVVIVYASNLRDLIGFLGLTLTACGAMTVASIWRIKHVFPDASALKWYEQFAAAVFIVLTCVMILVASTFQSIQFYTMIATFVSGLMFYALSKRFMLRYQSPE